MRIGGLCTGMLVGSLIWLAGCGGGGSQIVGVGAPGTVKLLVADAPAENVAEVNVNVTRVDLLYDGQEDSLAVGDTDATALQTREEDAPVLDEESDDAPVTIFTGNQTIDLLSLANKPLEQLLQLSQVTVPSGHYKQMRVYLGQGNTVKLTDGSVHPLKVPSNVLKIRFEMYVSPLETETVLLDFNLGAPGSLGLNQGQGYMLTPVLRVIRPTHTGMVTGTVRLPDGFVPTEEISVTIAISAQNMESTSVVRFPVADGTVTPTSLPFVLHGIPAGSYTITATIFHGDQQVTMEIPNVAVVTGETTMLDAVVLDGLMR